MHTIFLPQGVLKCKTDANMCCMKRVLECSLKTPESGMSSRGDAFCPQTSTRGGIYSSIPISSFLRGASGILLTSVDKKHPLYYWDGRLWFDPQNGLQTTNMQTTVCHHKACRTLMTGLCIVSMLFRSDFLVLYHATLITFR